MSKIVVPNESERQKFAEQVSLRRCCLTLHVSVREGGDEDGDGEGEAGGGSGGRELAPETDRVPRQIRHRGFRPRGIAALPSSSSSFFFSFFFSSLLV